MFSRLRATSGVSEKSFWEDIANDNQHYMLINSNSGSGCDVYFTYVNYRYTIHNLTVSLQYSMSEMVILILI